MATPERLLELSRGYNLDDGGYTFENAPEALGGAVVVWTDPDLDYIGIQDIVHTGSLSCPVYAFAPNEGHHPEFEWPESYLDGDGDTMLRVAHGSLNETDHICHCHGQMVTWTGAAGEPTKPLPSGKVREWAFKGLADYGTGADVGADHLFFEHTGNTDHKPYPDCDRCDGDGTLTSHGGEWAVYAYEDVEEEDDC
jgi:hypothetical protein